jgi:hypothetical protein
LSQNIILNENTHFNVGQYSPDGSFKSYGCFRTNEDAVFMLRWMNGGDTGKTWDTDNEHCGFVSAPEIEYSFYGENGEKRNYPFTIEEENKFKKEAEKRNKEEKEHTDKHREDATLVKEVFWQTRDEWTFGLFSKVFRPTKDTFSMIWSDDDYEKAKDYDIPRTEYEMKPPVKWSLILSVCSAIFYLIGM